LEIPIEPPQPIAQAEPTSPTAELESESEDEVGEIEPEEVEEIESETEEIELETPDRPTSADGSAGSSDPSEADLTYGASTPLDEDVSREDDIASEQAETELEDSVAESVEAPTEEITIEPNFSEADLPQLQPSAPTAPMIQPSESLPAFPPALPQGDAMVVVPPLDLTPEERSASEAETNEAEISTIETSEAQINDGNNGEAGNAEIGEIEVSEAETPLPESPESLASAELSESAQVAPELSSEPLSEDRSGASSEPLGLGTSTEESFSENAPANVPTSNFATANPISENAASTPNISTVQGDRPLITAFPMAATRRVIEFGQPLSGSATAMNSAEVLPAGTILRLRYPGEIPLQLVEGQFQEVLVLAMPIVNAGGEVILAEGSQVIGRFETRSGRSQFVTQAIAIQGRNVLLKAESSNLADGSAEARVQPYAVGGTAEAVVGEVPGVNPVPVIAELPPNAISEIAPRVVIQPNQVVEVQLTEDLRL
jgi:hypothetical protein